MCRTLLIGLLALMTLAGCAPLQIINATYCSDAKGVTVCWQTTADAACKVTYCQDNLCYTSPLDEYTTKHETYISSTTYCPKVTIVATGRNGEIAVKELP